MKDPHISDDLLQIKTGIHILDLKKILICSFVCFLEGVKDQVGGEKEYHEGKGPFKTEIGCSPSLMRWKLRVEYK